MENYYRYVTVTNDKVYLNSDIAHEEAYKHGYTQIYYKKGR